MVEAGMLQVRHLLADKGGEVHAIGPDDPVLAAIQKMADRYIGALLVMHGDELVGIVSERDYARKIVLKGRSSSATPVRDIMTSPVITVDPADSVDTCMRLCTDSRVRHLPVVENGKVVGVLSIGDLVKAVISEQGAQIEQLERYIAG
jgi:CBS domain-containing protein